MELLRKYHLIFDSSQPIDLISNNIQQISRPAEILIDLVFSLKLGGLIFNLQSYLLRLMEVNYGLRHFENYFPEARRGSILVTKEIVYFTTNDEDNLENRIHQSFDKVTFNDFIKFLEHLLTLAEAQVSVYDQKVQKLYNIVYDVTQNYWINNIRVIAVENRVIAINVGILKISLKLNSDLETVTLYSTNIVRDSLPLKIKDVNFKEISQSLIEIIREQRN